VYGAIEEEGKQNEFETIEVDSKEFK